MSTNFGNWVEDLILKMPSPFRLSDVSESIRYVTGEANTRSLDNKIKYHLVRLNVPVIGQGGVNGITNLYSLDKALEKRDAQ